MAVDNSDEQALELAKSHGLQTDQLAAIEFAIGVLDRSQLEEALRLLHANDYQHDVWDDPVSKRLSIYVTCQVMPTLAIIHETQAALRTVMSGLDLEIDDWGAAI